LAFSAHHRPAERGRRPAPGRRVRPRGGRRWGRWRCRIRN